MSSQEATEFVKEKISQLQTCMKEITSTYVQHTLLKDAGDFSPDNIVLKSAKSYSDYMFDRFSLACNTISKFEQNTKQVQVDLCNTLCTSLQEFENEMNKQKLIMSTIFKESEDKFIKEMNSISVNFEEELKNHNDYSDSKYEQFMNNLNEIEGSFSSLSINLNKTMKSLRMNKKSPMFVFDNNKQYPVDIELISRYPGSYYYKLLKDEQLRNEDGDIYIDHDDMNYDIIMKYMKGDIIPLETMSDEEKQKLSDDLIYFNMPLRSDFLELRCSKEESDKLIAWKKNRIVLINNKKYNLLNEYLKKNNQLDELYNPCKLDEIQYNKFENEFTINLDMKYVDIIENYLENNNVIDLELLKEKQPKYIELISEMMLFGIDLKDDEISEIVKVLILFDNSSIVNDEYDEYFKQWLGNKKNQLLYRGSRDGFSASVFHSKCDNKGPTITIIKSTDEWIFGGYTSVSWNTSGNYQNDSNAFLFTLKNAFKVPPTKYKVTSSGNAICCGSSSGPAFGGGYDIYLSNNCNSNMNSYCSYGGSGYAIYLSNNCNSNMNSYCSYGGSGYEQNSTYRCKLFVNTNDANSTNKFQVSDYEVYSVANS